MKRYIIILSMVLAVVGCKKAENAFDAAGAGETLTAHIGGPESKVSFDASTGKFAWSDPNDEIALHTSASGYQTATVQPSGVFSFGTDRDGYAFYPSGVAGGTAAAPVVILPSSYNITAEGMGDWYPTPMIAVNDPASDDLWFYHVGGALRLTLDNVPAGTAKLVITMGKGITGNFTVNDPDSATPAIAAGLTEDALIFNLSSALGEDTDGIVLNIPLPAGTYPKVQIAAWNGSDALLASGGSYKDWTFPRGRGRQLSYDFALNIVGSHEFSVSPVKTVEFAHGNLWNISGTWKFAPEQYSVLGVYDADAWELFGYSTDHNNNYGMSISDDNADYYADDCSFVDWGGVFPGEGWRTLQGCEMAYLLGKFEYVHQYDPNAFNEGEDIICAPITDFGRNGGNPHALRGYATIYTADAAIQGFVILPDAWETPEGCRPFVGGRWQRATGEEAYLDNTYNAGGTAGTCGDWARMEAAGAVFLPGCKFRIEEDIVSMTPQYHGYWSSTFDDDAYYDHDNPEVLIAFGTALVFVSGDDDDYGFNNIIEMNYGAAVRLVKDVTIGTLENIVGNVGYAGEYGVGTL